MKKLAALTLITLLTYVAHAAEPLKVLSFRTEVISPEADVELVTLQVRHNADPEVVTLSYTTSDKEVTISRYEQYDIVNMGSAASATITVTLSDGISTARSTWLHTRNDLYTEGYYKDRELWEIVAKPFLKRGEPFRFVEADDSLPDVLIIGNSSSIGYTPFVREGLCGEANVYRISENAGDTNKAMDNIERWLSDVEWDVIHVNWGLHDIKYTISDSQQDVPPSQYRENLRALFQRLTDSGATIIWATTSYVPEGCTPRRDMGDEVIYNNIALEVLKEFPHITIDDQYTLTKEHPEQQLPHNVHFTDEGYREQAAQASTHIRRALAK